LQAWNIAPKHAPERNGGFPTVSKAGGAKDASGRNGRLAGALRDNLRRRKRANRPAGEAADEPAPGAGANATPPEKTAGGGREG